MSVIEIIQLTVLIFNLLKQMEGEEPNGDAIKDAITAIAQVFGNTEVAEAVATIPGDLLLAIAKLFAGK